jgi:predicted Zn-dependent protease
VRKVLFIILCVIFATPGYAASLINDTETERVITDLIAPLAAAADIPDGRLRVHIVGDNQFNAFVMGGEDVYVYTGLLTQIKSPDALQAVVAHELGHTIGGHMTQMSDRMSAEMLRTMIIQALGIGLMAVGGDPSLGAGVLAGSSGVAQQSMLAFTRDEERIADDMGLKLMIRAGLNPDGFVQVFEQMGHMTGALESRINPNRINHPLTAERLNNVRAQIEKMDSDYIPTNAPTDAQRAEFELVRAKLIGYLDSAENVATAYPKSDTSDAALYAHAIAYMRGGNLDAARTTTLALIDRAPDNPYFYELLGDVEYQLGHYDDSVSAYEKSLELTDNAPQIETALALVLSERNKSGDRARAIELCKRALLTSPMPLTYWVLARAYDDGRADWARAEYYHMMGKKELAREYARRARKSLKPNTPEYIKSGDILG